EADVVHRTGAVDDLHEQYPATDAEALAPRALDKRLAPAWLHQCYAPVPPLDPGRQHVWPVPPALPGLVVYRVLRAAAREAFAIGADAAAGHATSAASALTGLGAYT